MLGEADRNLKKGGIFFISSLCAGESDPLFPISFDPVTRVLMESGSPYRYIPTPDELQGELLSSGFIILNTEVRTESPFGHINIHAKKMEPDTSVGKTL